MPKQPLKHVEAQALIKVLKGHAQSVGPLMPLGDLAESMGWSLKRTLHACRELHGGGDVELERRRVGAASKDRLVKYLTLSQQVANQKAREAQPANEDLANCAQLLMDLQSGIEEHFDDERFTYTDQADDLLRTLADARRLLTYAMAKLDQSSEQPHEASAASSPDWSVRFVNGDGDWHYDVRSPWNGSASSAAHVTFDEALSVARKAAAHGDCRHIVLNSHKMEGK